MEASIVSIVSGLVSNGMLTETTLSVCVLFSLAYIHIYYLKPIKDSVSKITAENIESAIADATEKECVRLSAIMNELDKINVSLVELKTDGDTSEREIQDIKRDVQHIREILNQFQGHLLYTGTERRNAFGNRELS